MANRTGKIKILIVDDLEFMRSAIREILTAHGDFSIDEAENGKEGVSKYKSFNPDVVLMDITMPVMDGIKALAGIRSFNKNARVIMCSALGQEEYILKSIQLGAKDFIVKPFRPERITSAIHKVLQRR
jgi:two-component system, chemotaxis family, chemotaxis protein CheY